MSKHLSMSTNQATRERASAQRSARIEREERAAFARSLRTLDGLRLQGMSR